MAKTSKTTVIVPTPLPPRSKRPGPADRRLASYLELSSALSSKELLSEWSSPEAEPSITSELQLREALTRTLSEHCYFGYIRPGSKLPYGHSKPGAKRAVNFSTGSGFEGFSRPNGTDWLGSSTAPSSGNWSAIPKLGSRLMVFDLDVAKLKRLSTGEEVSTTSEDRYLEARRSIGHLESLLSMDLRGSYAQLSPSGGIHIFVLLPEAVNPQDLPSAKISNAMRSLAGIPEVSWATELRGDIRSGASNGFILMAGSRLEGLGDSTQSYSPLVADSRWRDFKDYRSGRKLRLLELSDLAVQRLREAKLLEIELRDSRGSVSASIDDAAAIAPEQSTSARSMSRELKGENFTGLLRRLTQSQPRPHHAARAHIYRALSCCGSFESIAQICRDAGYARDSYGDRELSDGELLADMEAMDRRGLGSSRCGVHCRSSAGRGPAESLRSQQLEDLSSSMLAERVEGIELSALSHQRAKDSSMLGARAMLQLNAQRSKDFGIYSKRNPLGLDYGNLAVELLGSRLYGRLIAGDDVRIAGYRLRALELAVSYFGPLFSAGASVAIAPASELMELFGWSRSQLREALRFLRSSGVLRLAKRQSSGRASGYGPGEKRFYDPILSRKLRSTWGLSRIENEDGEQSFLGGFFDYSRGRIVRPDGSSHTESYLREVGGGFKGLLEQLQISLPRSRAIAISVVERYLRRSLERYLRIQSPAIAVSAAIEPQRSASNRRAESAHFSIPVKSLEATPELWINRVVPRQYRTIDQPRSPSAHRSCSSGREPPDRSGHHSRHPIHSKDKKKEP